MDNRVAVERIKNLPCWQGSITAAPLGGGLTNVNYTVTDTAGKYVVRLAEDIPVHHVMRFNELSASRAAHAAGISPEIVHVEPGVLVMDFIDARTLTPKDICDQATLERIIPVIRTCHNDVPKHFRGPALMFWVFHVIRDYAATLQQNNSRHVSKLNDLLTAAGKLEKAVGQIDLVYGHNDLLAANFLDDGNKLWLIDWDYAGFNSPLFDLGGLASNNGLLRSQEMWMLENYFDAPVTDGLLHRYDAMKCASLMREAMWSMVSEIHPIIPFDFASHTTEYLSRFHTAYSDFQS